MLNVQESKFPKLLIILRLIIITIILMITIVYLREYIFKIRFGTSRATENSEKIGTVSLYTSPVFNININRITGHSWIYIKNTSDKSFFIGEVEVPKQSSISLGTTAHPKFLPSGIWFNIEGYNTNYHENISITSDFYIEDLVYLQEYIEKHDRWTIFYNCATFATGLWNNLYSGTLYPVKSMTPKSLYKEINKMKESKINYPYEIKGEMMPYVD